MEEAKARPKTYFESIYQGVKYLNKYIGIRKTSASKKEPK